MKLSEQVRSTHTRDGAVLLDILHGRMYRLNVVGSRMLELLKQGRCESQIAGQISLEFCAPLELVSNDLRELLAHLQKHHLIEFGQVESELLR